MSAERIIGDGHGSGSKAKVSKNGQQEVILVTHPVLDNPQIELPFRSYFTDSSGSNAMSIDGSVTNQKFSISANDNNDIFITSISIFISDDNNPALNKFGGEAALANGLSLVWSTNEEGDYTFAEGLKTNMEMIRLGLGTPSFGDGATAFLADNTGGLGTLRAYLPVVDVVKTFGLHHGLRLKKGSPDKLTFIVKDDLTAIAEFNIIAFGKRI